MTHTTSMLAPHLQGWRLARGLTSQQLAAQASVSFGAISRAENGRPIRRATLSRLAAALQVSVEALVSVEAPPLPPDAPLALRTRSRARVPYRAPAMRQSQRDDPLYLKQLASFPAWLLAQQHRPDRIGAIARAADAMTGSGALRPRAAPPAGPHPLTCARRGSRGGAGAATNCGTTRAHAARSTGKSRG